MPRALPVTLHSLRPHPTPYSPPSPCVRLPQPAQTVATSGGDTYSWGRHFTAVEALFRGPVARWSFRRGATPARPERVSHGRDTSRGRQGLDRTRVHRLRLVRERLPRGVRRPGADVHHPPPGDEGGLPQAAHAIDPGGGGGVP